MPAIYKYPIHETQSGDRCDCKTILCYLYKWRMLLTVAGGFPVLSLVLVVWEYAHTPYSSSLLVYIK